MLMCAVPTLRWSHAKTDNEVGTCARAASFAMASPDGRVWAVMCDDHADPDHSSDRCAHQDVWDFKNLLNIPYGVTVSYVSIFCESCRQRLPMDRYPGPKCPDCMRTAMIVGATQQQTAAMLALRKTIKRYQKETRPMTSKIEQTAGFFEKAGDMAKGIGLDEMALRAVARQVVKTVKEPLSRAIAARVKGRNTKAFMQGLDAFLATDFGDATVSIVMGGIVMVAPVVPEMIRPRLARELIIGGGATVMDTVLDVVTGPIRQALSGAAEILADPAVAGRISDASRIGVVPVDAKPTVPTSA